MGRRSKLRAARALQPSDAGTNLTGRLVPGIVHVIITRTRLSSSVTGKILDSLARELSEPPWNRVERRTWPPGRRFVPIHPELRGWVGCHTGSRRPVTPIVAGERCGARGSSHRGRHQGRAESPELRCLTQEREGALAHRRSAAQREGNRSAIEMVQKVLK